MTERQGHGLMFEAYLSDMMDAYENDENYTGEYDAYFTTANGERFVSVKNTSKRGEICLGDFDRIVNSTEHVIMFDGRHDARVAMPSRIIVHDLPRGFAEVFVGDQADAVCELVEEFRDYMFSEENLDLETARDESGNAELSFNDREFDPYWKKRRVAFTKAYKELFEGDDIWIHPRPKRDHKKQKRLQCAIPRRHIKDFYNAYAVYELIFHSDGTITIFDYTGHPYGELCDDEGVSNIRVAHDGYIEYLFDTYDDEDQEDMERRAWSWMEQLIYNEL